MNNILVIVGPTAVGKTYVSIELAKQFETEIISADSMQIYKHMDIGTAKVTEEESCGIKHHMIDIINPDDSFSVSDFKEMSEEHIDAILKNNKLPIIIGGSGLYVNSLIYDLNFGNTKSDENIRTYYTEFYNEHGKEKLYELLKEVDPEACNKIHMNNIKRVIRALEVCKTTGQKFSDLNTNIRKPCDKYNAIIVGLKMDRKLLYERINKRVDIMIEDGLVHEVEELLKKYDKKLVSMQGIGYKEIIDFIEGNITMNEAVEILKTNTRRFAKRQFTWFNGDSNIKWFDITDIKNLDIYIDNIYNYVLGKL